MTISKSFSVCCGHFMWQPAIRLSFKFCDQEKVVWTSTVVLIPVTLFGHLAQASSLGSKWSLESSGGSPVIPVTKIRLVEVVGGCDEPGSVWKAAG